MPVRSSPASIRRRFRAAAPREAIPQRKLETSKQIVSIVRFDISRCGAGTVALPATTWNAAKKAENMTISDSRKIQNPNDTTILLDVGPPSPRPGASELDPNARLPPATSAGIRDERSDTMLIAASLPPARPILQACFHGRGE